MVRVYVAGAYSADNVIDVLKNIGRGEKVCAKLFKAGFAPFCPWHDKTYVMEYPDHNFTVEQFYRYSVAWLEVSHALYVLPDSENSKGTQMEIDRAKKLGIPIFYDLESLIND